MASLGKETPPVAGDTNRRGGVFVRDVRTGVTQRVSVLDNGEQFPTGGAGGARSAHGRVAVLTANTRTPADGPVGGISVFARDLRRGHNLARQRCG